jgi:amino acid transporter
MGKKTILSITLSSLIGLVLFLLILGILNFIKFDSLVNLQIVAFLNQSLGIIITLSILFYLGELFSIFIFPLNIPYPLFNALGSIYLVEFIFQIIYMIGQVSNIGTFFKFQLLEHIVIVIVFVIVIIVGYIKIIINLCSKEKIEKKKKKVKKKSITKKEDIEWEEIGNMFKMAAYNLATTLKDALEPKKNRRKKKK